MIPMPTSAHIGRTREAVARAGAGGWHEAEDDADAGDAGRPSSSGSRPASPWARRRGAGRWCRAGAIVWPCATWKAKPRQTRSPPRVTMNDGTPHVGDDEALEAADRRAQDDAQRQRDDPGVRVGQPEPERRWAASRPGPCAMTCPMKPEHRPDRQVDVARHDDQDHPGGHDRDGRGLDRQVPQVARREELAARRDVEEEPDRPRATTMPSSRVSSSSRREHRSAAIAAAARCPAVVPRSLAITVPRRTRLGNKKRPAPRRDRGAGR